MLQHKLKAMDEKKRSLLYFGCDFGTISGKSLKLLPPF